MSSFGENEILVGSRIVGRVRVRNVFAPPALFARLTFVLGVTLQDSPRDEFAPNRAVQAFEMRDLRGELRLEEHANVIGSIEWAGPRRSVRSAQYQSEGNIETVCDLDWIRLEKLEEHRAGREPILWLALWPTLVDSHGFLDSEVRPIRMTIPRDNWVTLLGILAGTRLTVIEVVCPVLESPDFDAAVGHIKDARDRVNLGNFDEAVAACRRAIESLSNALDVGHKTADLEQAIAAVTDERRGKAYSGIVSRLKELASHTIHRPEAPGRFTRAEAQFVIGSTEHALALLAAILRRRKMR